jgi:2-oxoglutarate dehydrogenase E2 component (dihydrolipoamide succinyltransferase)
MPTEVKIPALGESVTGGLISKWHKQDGDAVKSGDVLLTLETDKVAQDIAAESAGVLRHRAKEGDEVVVGALVAVIEESGAANTERPTSNVEAAAAPPEIGSQKSESGEQKRDAAPAAKEPQLKILPKPATPASELRPPVSELSAARTTRKKMSPLRRKIAEQLVNAQRTAAMLTTFNECDMTAVMALRKQLQDDFVKKHGVKLGFMSFFVKAAVDALKAVPQVNARVDGDEVVTHHFFDIGVAVGTERGLIVPVLRDCDTKSFAGIERDIAGYAVRAKEGKISLDDLTGGVFTISNGGVYGSLMSTPILNPPQSGILGLHAIKDRPVAENGQVVIRPMMYLALSYDHRVVDGKEAVTFLVRLKDCIENPARLLLEA